MAAAKQGSNPRRIEEFLFFAKEFRRAIACTAARFPTALVQGAC